MAVEVLMPKLGLTMTEGTVDSWLVQQGDPVKKGEPICTISSEKLTYDVEAPEDGTLIKIVVAEGEDAPCITPIGYIGQSGESLAVASESNAAAESVDVALVETTSPSSQSAVEAVKRPDGQRIFATPLARKIAKEKDYDLALIHGTGGNGRITRRDVEAYVPVQAPKPAEQGASLQAVGEGLQGMRKTIAQRMRSSLANTAQLTFHRKADITQLMAFRQETKEKAGKVKGNPLNLTVLLTRAVVLALQDHPEVNAWYDGQTLTRHDHVHIGVAVALDEGLMVPVLKEADHMSLSQLAQGIDYLASGARSGSLVADELTGSTFTITNLGNLGVEYFTPVLNTPEVGILGVGALTQELILNDDGNVEQRIKLPLSLTTDHQVLDGTPAAEFFDSVISYLGNPYSLIL